ncbi:MAG: hypothetical protein PWQ93_1417 [Clostridiales bacterium]|jgi:hypothetical protein|nr:hypothetical protein [Clostridiales bacterium]
MVQGDELKKAFQSIISAAVPDVKRVSYPIRGKVIYVYDDGTADIQPLGPDNEPSDIPILPRLKASTAVAIGKLVRICFYYGDTSQPYIDGVIE